MGPSPDSWPTLTTERSAACPDGAWSDRPWETCVDLPGKNVRVRVRGAAAFVRVRTSEIVALC